MTVLSREEQAVKLAVSSPPDFKEIPDKNGSSFQHKFTSINEEIMMNFNESSSTAAVRQSEEETPIRKASRSVLMPV